MATSAGKDAMPAPGLATNAAPMKASRTLSHSTLFGLSFRMKIKGRELVQDIGVSDPHVVYSPEIAEDAHCADAAAQEHIQQARAGDIEFFP